MNKKITILAENGQVLYCVIDDQQDRNKQLALVVLGRPEGHGIGIHVTDTEIQRIDYYHAEVMNRHQILSIEDTMLPVSLQWNIENA